jgi:hypothetical protein
MQHGFDWLRVKTIARALFLRRKGFTEKKRSCQKGRKQKDNCETVAKQRKTALPKAKRED